MIFDLTGTLLLILSHNLSIFGFLIPYFGIFLNLKPSSKSSRNKTKLAKIQKYVTYPKMDWCLFKQIRYLLLDTRILIVSKLIFEMWSRVLYCITFDSSKHCYSFSNNLNLLLYNQLLYSPNSTSSP